MEYIEESTKILTSNSKVWIRKRTDPLIYIIFFFITLTLAFTAYWMFIPVGLGVLLTFYSVKKDLILDFAINEINISTKILFLNISHKRISLNELIQLLFVAELRDEQESNMYKPFMYYLHIRTPNQFFKTHCYFESKESVWKFVELVNKYSNSISIDLDMNGLTESEKHWNG